MSPWLTTSRRFVELSTRYEPPGERTVKAGSWPGSSARASGPANGTIKSQFMYGRLAPKEFIRVDHPRQPCSRDEGSEADCEIDCFQSAVVAATGCKYAPILIF